MALRVVALSKPMEMQVARHTLRVCQSLLRLADSPETQCKLDGKAAGAAADAHSVSESQMAAEADKRSADKIM